MVLDRLLALGLIGAEAVSIWAFETAIPATLSEQASASSAWEVEASQPMHRMGGETGKPAQAVLGMQGQASPSEA
eukprot:161493-Pelagomonas_calceolata.AAC.4